MDYQKRVVSLKTTDNVYTGKQLDTATESGDNLIEAVVYHQGGDFTLGAYSDTWFEIDDFKLTRYENYYNAWITDAQYSTVCLPIRVQVPANLIAYRVDHYTESTSKTRLEPIQPDGSNGVVVPAYTPFVVKARPEKSISYTGSGTQADPYVVTEEEIDAIATDGKQDFNLTWTDATAATVGTNKMHGKADGPLMKADRNHTTYTYYVMAKMISGTKYDVGFYQLKETNPYIPRFRAFTRFENGEMTSKNFYVFSTEDDETDGIEATQQTVSEGDVTVKAIYAPNGMRVNSLQHGMNIIRMSDGTVKKVIIRK